MRVLHWVLIGLAFLGTPGKSATDEDLVLQEQWARRDAWQLPEQVITALKLKPGDVVADLGAGKGYFSHRLAHAVGEEGKVIALDINAQSLEINLRLALEKGLTNLETRVVEFDDPGLGRRDVDLIFICKTWHFLPDRLRYAALLRECVREGGRMAVIGSGRESRTRISSGLKLTDRYEVQREAEAAGWSLEVEHEFLPRQFFLQFRPGRAKIEKEIDGFRYLTSELAVGTGPPDSTALVSLRDRGFLKVVDLRSGDKEATQLRASVQSNGMHYVNCSSEEPLYFKALASHLNDPDAGIVFVFGYDPTETGVEIANLVAAGEFVMTAFEEKRLKEWLSN